MTTCRLMILCLLSLVVASAGAETPAFTAIDGKPHQPLDFTARKATVFIFTATDCPIANGYAPEINRICEKYAASAAIFLIHADPALKNEDARKHAAEYRYTCPVLLDPEQKIVAHAKATITPEAAVFSSDGKLAYRGRINDLHVDLGRKRASATTHDLRDALDAVLAGKAVAQPETKAVGCFIPEKKDAKK